MKNFKSMLFVCALISTGVNAGGTPDSGGHPAQSNISASAGQGQSAEQSQQQGQIGINKNANLNTAGALSGSNSGATSGSNSGASSNGVNALKNSTNMDSSNSAVTSGNTTGVTTAVGGSNTTVGGSTTTTSYTVVPSLSVQVTPSILASAVQTVIASECGPLQSIVSQSINGTVIGYMSETSVKQGETITLSNYINPVTGQPQFYFKEPIYNQDKELIGYQMFGHQVITSMAVVGTSAARQAAIGGGSSSGWGQGSAGSSSGMQQPVSHIVLRVCELPQIKFTKEVKENPKPLVIENKPSELMTCGTIPQKKKHKKKQECKLR